MLINIYQNFEQNLPVLKYVVKFTERIILIDFTKEFCGAENHMVALNFFFNVS